MKGVGRIERVNLSDDDVRAVRHFVCLLVVLVVLLVATHGRDLAWPFVVWSMYAKSYGPPPLQVSETELRLVGREGEVTHLLPGRLLTQVEIELARRVAVQAFVQQPGAEHYRAALLRKLRPVLAARDVVEIQGWTLAWTANPAAVPPFDLVAPDEEILLGTIHVQDDHRGAESTLRDR